MSKPRILFVAHTMNVGGVEKALLMELTSLSPNEYDIHVALLEQKGGFLQKLPSHITLHEISFYKENKYIFNNPPLSNINHCLRNKKYLFAFRLLWTYICYKLNGTQKVLFDNMFRNIPEFPIKFDKAYAYAGPFPFIDYFVTKKVNAQEKQVWIHYDISKINTDCGIINKLYHNYNKINIVSQQGKDIFDKRFPHFETKTQFYPNKINEQDILSLATEIENPFAGFCGINIVTVGRVSKEKGQFMTLKALKLLIDAGHDVYWHYIGTGNDIDNCKKKTQELWLNKNVFFHGVKENPYPYMKHCDIYVQPSLYECYCTTINEIKIFNKPIVATNFTGIKEQLINYHPHCEIVEYSSNAIFEGIVKILKNL